jgi:putative ABC transport system permease protein
MSIWMRRLAALLRRGQLDRQLREELAQHVDARARQLMRDGVAPDEARRRAAIAVGNVTRLREESRDHWGLPALDSLLQDARYALRQLRRTPLFTTATTFTLTLTIGSTSALFAVANAVVFRPLPYPDSGRIVSITIQDEGRDVGRMDAPTAMIAMRAGTRSLQAVAALDSAGANLTGAAQPERIVGRSVSGGFFDVMAVRPTIGRTFAADELVAGGPPAVIVSRALWERAFGATTEIGARVLKLGDVDHRVVGVMPAGFNFPEGAEFWRPWQPRGVGSGAVYYTDFIGRLRPGIDAATALEELQALRRAHDSELPARARTTQIRIVSLHQSLRGSFRTPLVLLLAIVACVLLIACANVANLLLARASERRRELGLRTALGASRGRLVRQLLVESLLLSALGIVPGLLFANGSLQVFKKIGPPNLVRLRGIEIDATVFLFTLAVTLAAGLLFGIAPAIAAGHVDPQGFLKRTDGSGGDRGRSRPKRLLVVMELAAAVVLTIGAALLAKSFIRYSLVERGFDERQVVVASVSLPRSRYADAVARRDFSERVLERLRSAPSISSAAHTNGHLNALTMTIPLPARLTQSGRSSEAELLAVGYVGRDHFKTMGMRIIAGRECAGTGDGLAAVVSASMAALYFPERSALGETIDLSGDGSRTIIGVAADVRRLDTRISSPPHVYGCLSGNDVPLSGTIAVRVRDGVPADSAIPLLREAVRAVDPAQPLTNVRTMSTIVGQAVTSRWFDAALIAAFASIAVVLSTFGLYAVIAYLVAQRTHEIGVRVALGARRTDVVGLVVRQGAAMTAAGIALGVIAAVPLVRLVRSMLFGVEPLDVTMFAAATLLLIVVASLATFIPALRATRVDPIVALRTE